MDNHEIEWFEQHERIKYRLILNLVLLFFVLMLVIGIFNSISHHMKSIPNFLICGMCLVGYFILKFTRKFQLVAIFCSLFSLLVIFLSFTYFGGTNYLTPFWMMVNVIFTFFVLGNRWGVVILLANFGLILYNFFALKEPEFVLLDDFDRVDFAMFIIEFCMIVFALGHLLVLYTRTAKIAEEGLTEINGRLLEKNNLISKQNSEMEVMLREIHHRVKNNLQIVSSLLRLQAEKAIEKKGDFYQEAIDRVSAMAIVHEKMYQSGSLSQFDLDKYIHTLVNNLLRNYALDKVPEVQIDVYLHNMQSKSIVPFALLINELILNSLKHAFAKQEHPRISIVIQEGSIHGSVERFQFIYSDNGTWMENAEPSFGSEIIVAMTEQMDGKFKRDISREGTKYQFDLANLR